MESLMRNKIPDPVNSIFSSCIESKKKLFRIWYIEQTIQNGWSRDILRLMIKSAVHLRQGNAVTNFNLTLPDPQSDLAQQSLKDPYIFDFLTLTEPFKERELETELVKHLRCYIVVEIKKGDFKPEYAGTKRAIGNS